MDETHSFGGTHKTQALRPRGGGRRGVTGALPRQSTQSSSSYGQARCAISFAIPSPPRHHLTTIRTPHSPSPGFLLLALLLRVPSIPYVGFAQPQVQRLQNSIAFVLRSPFLFHLYERPLRYSFNSALRVLRTGLSWLLLCIVGERYNASIVVEECRFAEWLRV